MVLIEYGPPFPPTQKHLYFSYVRCALRCVYTNANSNTKMKFSSYSLCTISVPDQQFMLVCLTALLRVDGQIRHQKCLVLPNVAQHLIEIIVNQRNKFQENLVHTHCHIKKHVECRTTTYKCHAEKKVNLNL